MKKKICSLVLVMTLIFTSLVFTSPQTADATSATYTVRFLPNGGSGSMSNQKFTYQKYQTLKKCTFKRTNYAFKGWYAHQKTRDVWYCTNGKTFGWYNEKKIPSGWRKSIISDGWRGDRLTNINNDIVSLVAQWSPIYTICFDRAAAGIGYMNNYAMVYGSGQAIPSCTFKRPGYIFAGWKAYRVSDGKMYFTDGKTTGWYKSGKQPSGWYYRIGPDNWKIHKATTLPGDKIILYAQWKVNPAAKVVTKAQSQIGKGGSTYWKWYGFEGDWCAMFASWCINQCGLGKAAGGKQAGCITWSNWLKNNGKYKVRGSYVPKAGDLIFLETNNKKFDGVDHVGIVEKVQNGRVYTIEGNTNSDNIYKSVVARHNYSLNNTNIYGYGVYA